MHSFKCEIKQLQKKKYFFNLTTAIQFLLPHNACSVSKSGVREKRAFQNSYYTKNSLYPG